MTKQKAPYKYRERYIGGSPSAELTAEEQLKGRPCTITHCDWSEIASGDGETIIDLNELKPAMEGYLYLTTPPREDGTAE